VRAPPIRAPSSSAPDAEFIVSFNGDPAKRGSSEIETMEFDSHSNSFLFASCSFRPTRADRCRYPRPTPLAASPATASGAADLGHAAFMAGCLWRRYGAGLSAKEAQGMREFLALQPTHARLRQLLGATAFAERATYVGSSTRVQRRQDHASERQLSALLTALNNRSIMSEMAFEPGLRCARYVLLAAPKAAAVRCRLLSRLHEPEDRSLSCRSSGGPVPPRIRAQARRWRWPCRCERRYRRGAAAARVVELRFVVGAQSGPDDAALTLALEGNTTPVGSRRHASRLPGAVRNGIAVNDPGCADWHHYR